MNKIFSTSISAQNLDIALLLLRITIAVLMLTHGIPKLDMLSADPIAFIDFMGLGPKISLYLTIFAEVICSFLLLFGIATRLAVIPLIVTMLVAIFVVHINDPFMKMEMGIHYLLVYIVLLLLGSGKYSVEYVLTHRKQQNIE